VNQLHPKYVFFLAVFWFMGCGRSEFLPNPDLPASPSQTAQLLAGDWIEDSVDLANLMNIPCVSPSFLHINSDMTYTMLQTTTYNTPANPSIDNDTGQFVDIGSRYITASSTGGLHYFGEFGKLQINRLTDHTLVLFSILNIDHPPVWYYHR
jgi:hypothetical protein